MSDADSFKAVATLAVGDAAYEIYRLDAAGRGSRRCQPAVQLEDPAGEPAPDRGRRQHHGRRHRGARRLGRNGRLRARRSSSPRRVIMQDFTGVPAVVDLATMREAMKDLGGDPAKINPLAPAELVIDHSVIADVFGTASAFERNVEIEYQRNKERYQFLRWGQGAFDDFKVVPPGTGIVHQVNIEHLARSCSRARRMAPPSRIPTRVSAPTPTPRWSTVSASWAGVSAASRPRRRCSVSRCRCSSHVWWASSCQGELPEGATATDLVLTITERAAQARSRRQVRGVLRAGRLRRTAHNRATIGNMSPEHGSTIAVFPIDDETPRAPPHRPHRRSGRARRGLRQGAGPVARPRGGAALLPRTSSRPVDGRPVDRRPEAAAGPISLADAKQAFRSVLGEYVADHDTDEQGYDEASAESFPASDSPSFSGSNGSDPPHGHDTGRSTGRRASPRQ